MSIVGIPLQDRAVCSGRFNVPWARTLPSFHVARKALRLFIQDEE